MTEVKWIKITTDMFDNRKIRYLRRLPDGNNIVLIWIMLLTIAGRCNSGGKIFLTENIPYSTKMLADELDFKENTIKTALQVLEQLNMIVLDGDFLSVVGWEEHQNTEGMERIKEQTKKRVAKYREMKKLSECSVTGNVTCNVTVTPSNATDIDKEGDKDIDRERDSDPNSPPYIPPSGGKRDVFAEFAGKDQTLLAALRDYEAMRNKIRKPMTERARELAVLNLQKLGNSTEERVAIVNQSVANSWAGLFPLDAPSNRGGASRQKKYMTSAEYAEEPPDPMALRAIQKMMGGGDG